MFRAREMILYEDRSDQVDDMSEVLFKESWDFISVSRKGFVCVTLYVCLWRTVIKWVLNVYPTLITLIYL